MGLVLPRGSEALGWGSHIPCPTDVPSPSLFTTWALTGVHVLWAPLCEQAGSTKYSTWGHGQREDHSLALAVMLHCCAGPAHPSAGGDSVPVHLVHANRCPYCGGIATADCRHPCVTALTETCLGQIHKEGESFLMK